MLTTYVNTKSVNEKRLELFSKVSKRTLFTLIEQCDDGVLTPVKSAKTTESLLKSMDQILVAKLRDKFKI